FIAIFSVLISAQEINSKSNSYARSIIDTLTSESFAGRGYVDNGMSKAADFVANEFEKLGLEKINDSYFQEFTMPINVIQNAELTLNGKELQYGIDFIVKPNSKTQNFHQKEIYEFEPELFANSLKNDSLLINFIQRDMLAQHEKHVV